MMKTDLDHIKELCQEHLGVEDPDTIKTQRLGGLTNKNYKVEIGPAEYVVRLPGDGTEELINRREEHLCTQLANDIGIDSELLYFEDETGIKISRYVENAETMKAKSVKNLDNMKAIADVFKKLHNSGQSVPVVFDVFEKIEEYESVLRKCEEDFFWPDYDEVKARVYSLKEEVEKMDIPLTMCHNDPLCENFVKGRDKMYLVDWEYAGMNDPMWDIADIFIEAGFTPEEEEQFSQFYFEEEVDKQMQRRILINKVFLDFLWSLWGKQRLSNGMDLLDYANERYERTKGNLELLV